MDFLLVQLVQAEAVLLELRLHPLQHDPVLAGLLQYFKLRPVLALLHLHLVIREVLEDQQLELLVLLAALVLYEHTPAVADPDVHVAEQLLDELHPALVPPEVRQSLLHLTHSRIEYRKQVESKRVVAHRVFVLHKRLVRTIPLRYVRLIHLRLLVGLVHRLHHHLL